MRLPYESTGKGAAHQEESPAGEITFPAAGSGGGNGRAKRVSWKFREEPVLIDIVR